MNLMHHQGYCGLLRATAGYCRAFARLVSPRGGTFVNFALPEAIPKFLTLMQFPIRI